ncbi:MAG: hypothetical protein Q9183_001763 [Haloplaca sp. 2 TL-2023]
MSRFLLATFHLEKVLAAPTAGAMEDALDSLPEDLTKAFGETMHRIQSQTQDCQKIALDCLRWMTYAKSPLSAEALSNVLAMRKGQPTARSDYRPSLLTIRDCCHGLVSIDKYGHDVRLVHASVHTYILSCEHKMFHESESELARLCLAHMMLEPFASPVDRTEYEVMTLLHAHPFTRYAALQWVCDLLRCSKSKILFARKLPAVNTVLTKEFFQGHHVRAAARSATTNKAVLAFLSAKGPRTWACQIWEYSRPGLKPWDVEEASTCNELHVAALFGLTEVAQKLLSTCPINQPTYRGTTALMNACHSGYVDMVELLVGNGADISTTDRCGTALHHAAEAGHVPVIRQLLRFGLDPNVQSRDGRTPLFCAAQSRHCEVIRELINSNAKVDHVCPGVGTALQLVVASSPTPDVVHLLLQHHADPNLLVSTGMPLLHEVVLGQIGDEVLHLLLKHGTDVNHRSRYGSTALQIAASNNKLHFMRVLLDYGANVNAEAGKGYTALHSTARAGFPEAVKLLLQYGATPELPGTKVKTPLYLAVEYNRVEVVQMLLEAGADLKACTKSDGTPLDIFLKKGPKAACDLLVEWQAKNKIAVSSTGASSTAAVTVEKATAPGA